jgi:hypothetical protein
MQANRRGSETSTKKRQRVGCKVCGASLTAESFRNHMETQHDIFRSFVLNRDIIVAQPPVVYHATKLPATGLYFCPVAQCGGRLGTRFNLRRHFLMQHPQDLICIPDEGSHPLPKCEHCGLQTPVGDLNGGHHCTELCQQGWERKRQHAAAVSSQKAPGRSFTAYREELEKVEVFKFLGWLIAYDDTDTQAMWLNLRKARGCWDWISRVLGLRMLMPGCVECSTKQPCRQFYYMEVRHGICLQQV